MEQRLFVFAYNVENSIHPKYRGYFNGEQFIPKLGFCQSIKELQEYDYMELYGMDGMIVHSPKKFNRDIQKEFREVFVKEYGEIQQTSLFD